MSFQIGDKVQPIHPDKYTPGLNWQSSDTDMYNQQNCYNRLHGKDLVVIRVRRDGTHDNELIDVRINGVGVDNGWWSCRFKSTCVFD